MSALRWVWSAARRRTAESFATALAIALVVAYLASVGSFITATRADLTVRAAARVPVDWQVQLSPGADPAPVEAALANVPMVAGTRPVDLAVVPGLTSSSAGAVRTTGKAYIVGLPPDYPTFAPGEIRPLLGKSGVVLQQQTAANLAATVGDTVGIVDGPSVTVSGVVDFTAADSFFQVVGAPPGAGATAPPDNVLAVPAGAVFDSLTQGHTVIHQVHVRFDHSTLPRDPGAAAGLVSQRANNLAVTVAGAALVGDNLDAALNAAREDAIYAGLLVLLLGAPGSRGSVLWSKRTWTW